jgi:hypothetical protein
MHRTVETGVVGFVYQYCPAIEEVVTLRVRGSVFGDLINGEVIGCNKTRCHTKNTPYCWLQKHIQTKIDWRPEQK